MKIALLTAYDEKYAPLAEIAVPNFRNYCDRHGYTLVLGKYHTDPSRLLSYGDRGKIEAYCALYDRYDAVMWLDIDALVMNSALTIEQHVGGLVQFLWTYDRHGPLSGFWIACCIPEVRLFLEETAQLAARSSSLIVTEQGPPHTVRLQVEPHGISDQSAMRMLMGIPPFQEVARHCVPARESGHCFEPSGGLGDALTAYEPGKWLITFPGLSVEEKLAKMQHYAQLAK